MVAIDMLYIINADVYKRQALYRHSSLHIWRNFRERDMGGQDPVRQSDGGDWPHFLLVVSVSLAVSGLLPADKSGTRVRHMGTSSCIRRCFRALLPDVYKRQAGKKISRAASSLLMRSRIMSSQRLSLIHISFPSLHARCK